MRVAEAYEVLRSEESRAVFDQFGEEGLKNGLPKANGGWTEGFTFHADAKRVFRDFFGTSNPFADFQVPDNQKVILVREVALDSLDFTACCLHGDQNRG